MNNSPMADKLSHSLLRNRSRDSDPQMRTDRWLQFEPFVDADVAAEFLAMKRKTILDWARAGVIPAHPFGKGKRVVWRFRISEIASHNKSVQCTMGIGSPEMARLEEKYG